MMTTAEGGIVTFKSRKALDRARDLREYNFKKKLKIRYNYKMTDLQAAMGITQLKKLPSFIKRRIELAKGYNHDLKTIAAILPLMDNNIFYRYIILLEKPHVNVVIKRLYKHQIMSYCPIEPLHRYLRLNGFNNAEKLMKIALSIPIYPSLTRNEKNTITKAIKKEI
jgi:dTDP-4-amino-4,6-dideoxygalactose transaminase